MESAPPVCYAGKMLRVEEVARILNVSGKAVRDWCLNGTLKAIIIVGRTGRRTYRVLGEAIDQLLQEAVTRVAT